MKTVQKELIAKRQEIEEKLQTILYEDEKLELLYCGRQYASAYALIRRKDGMYYSFRFSDHKTTPYYSSKTFDIYAPITGEVLRNIRETLDKVSWCPFTLYDYLTLRTIYYFNNLRQPFCIDNTMNIFVGNKMGLLFYRRKRIGKDNWEFETVSESFQKELRKLFATGLLHAYTCKKTRTIQVYITEAGLSMIKDTDLENNNFVKHYLQFKTDPTFSSCLQLPTQNKKYKPFRSPWTIRQNKWWNERKRKDPTTEKDPRGSFFLEDMRRLLFRAEGRFAYFPFAKQISGVNLPRRGRRATKWRLGLISASAASTRLPRRGRRPKGG